MMNLIEDYYMPVRGSDNGTSIDTLKGLEYNMIDDINYLKGKLMAAHGKQHLLCSGHGLRLCDLSRSQRELCGEPSGSPPEKSHS